MYQVAHMLHYLYPYVPMTVDVFPLAVSLLTSATFVVIQTYFSEEGCVLRHWAVDTERPINV